MSDDQAQNGEQDEEDTGSTEPATVRVATGPNEVEAPLPALAADKKAAKPSKAHERFAKLAGVKAEEVMAFNADSYIGVTSNGGKYQMNKKGTQLRHLAGPVPEGLTSDAEAAQQERLEKEANA